VNLILVVAPVDSSMSDNAETSSAIMFARADDPMARRLRSEGTQIGIEELVDLNRQSPRPMDASTTGTLTSVFTSKRPSTRTQPTSAGTIYPIHDYANKGKAVATYASSSVSAIHGSGSDTELEASRENALTGLGDWAENTNGLGTTRALKGKARRRPPPRRPKDKKPVVILQQEGAGSASEEDPVPLLKQVPRRDNREVKYFRQRRIKPDQLGLAEEGCVSDTLAGVPPKSNPLPPSHLCGIIALVVMIVLTFAISIIVAHHTGKRRMHYTEGILFGATVLISTSTVLVMILARRAPQEALLAGMLEFLIGFALLTKVHDFM
jgi:hypothetical protein